MPGARLIIRRRARAPLRPRRGRRGGSRPSGRADARRSGILGCARSARAGRARSPGWTRRQQSGINAQRPAKRPQQAHDLRRGGEQRRHLRIAQQMPQLSAVTDRLRTRQPDEPGEILRQTLRRRLRRVGFRSQRSPRARPDGVECDGTRQNGTGERRRAMCRRGPAQPERQTDARCGALGYRSGARAAARSGPRARSARPRAGIAPR